MLCYLFYILSLFVFIDLYLSITKQNKAPQILVITFYS